MDIETCCQPQFCDSDTHASALDPTKGRITCIGLHNDELSKVFYGPDERKVLEDFWSLIDSQPIPPTFITYNGLQFDLPYLKFRSIANGLRPHWLSAIDTLDMMQKLFPYGTTRRSKDAVCNGLGIPAANGWTGADAPRMWHEGKHSEVAQHCLDDVRREWLLYCKLHEAGLV